MNEQQEKAVAWRPSLKMPTDFTTGKPTQQTIDYWAEQGVEIEYAYTAPPSVEELQKTIGELEDKIEQLELDEGIWPEWAEKLLKMARKRNGNDSQDDADGVCLLAEMELAFDMADVPNNELEAEVETLRTANAAQAEQLAEANRKLLQNKVCLTLAVEQQDNLTRHINKLRELRSFLCSTIECGVLEQHVLPALDQFDALLQSSIPPEPQAWVELMDERDPFNGFDDEVNK